MNLRLAVAALFIPFLLSAQIVFAHKPDTLSDSAVRALPKKGCINFLALSDWGVNGHFCQTAVADEMGPVACAMDATFIVSMGDNFQAIGVRSTSDPLWMLNFESVYTHPYLEGNWYPILGNHDYRGDPQAEIDYSKISRRWNMPARYYAVHKKACDSVTLDLYFLDTSPFQKKYYGSEVRVDGQDTAAQLRWLDSALAASRSRWKLVFGHHPLYTSGRHGPDLKEMPGRFEPLFAKYHVDAYFCGHDHDFEHLRSKNSAVNFFVAGTGGAPFPPARRVEGSLYSSSQPGFLLVNVDAQNLTVSMIDTAGSVLYSTVVKKDPSAVTDHSRP